jgi:uncharacterized membrane protein YphA (DoxX/SURF4 family)
VQREVKSNTLSVKRIIKKIMAISWLRLLVRVSIAAVFVYAGFVKIIDPKAFARVISHYDMVPESLLPFIAIGLPVLELFAGLALAFNIRGSLSVITGLLMLFSIVLGYGIFNNLNIDCGCFNSEELSQQQNLKLAFYRDLILIGGVFFLFMSGRYSPKNAMNENILERIKTITQKRRF